MFSKILYYLIVLPISYLPLKVLYLISDFLSFVLIYGIPYRKKVIRKNLLNSFPEKTLDEIKTLEQKFYRHFTDLLVEGVKNLTISTKQLSKRLIVENSEIMDQLYAQNKSVLLVSGHYNNWEWIITSQSRLFKHKALGIGMPLTSKFWDKKVNDKRSRNGMTVVHAKNLKNSLQNLKDTPTAILILGDQSPGDSLKSYWMQFLHQETAVLFGTEQLANEYDYAVVYFTIKKIKRGYYKMALELITNKPKELEWGEITEKHTHLLEKEIVGNPENWLWTHKRWKRNIPENLAALKLEQQGKFNSKYRSHC